MWALAPDSEPRTPLALATPRRYRSRDYYGRVAGSLYGGQARRDPDALLRGSVARFSEPPSALGYIAQLDAISFWTAVPWLWRLPQPTLVLSGDDDPIVPAINGRILTWLIPDARLKIIRGAGHLFLLERPAPNSPRSSPHSSWQRSDRARVVRA